MNIKTKIIAIDELYNFSVDNDEIDIVKYFVYVVYIIRPRETASKKSKEDWELDGP